MFLSISEAAKLFDVSTNTLRNWEENGKLLPDIKTKGKHRRYNYDKIKKLIEENKC